MKRLIDIEEHAFYRIVERGLQYNLTFEETEERILRTVSYGRLSKRKHLSKINKIYYHYFSDGLTFYVICKEQATSGLIIYKIKTVIIEYGR